MRHAVCLLLVLCLTACRDSAPAPASHDAYIWQRAWTPALRQAVRDGGELFAQWRMLAAHSDGAGRIAPTGADWAALADSGRPAIAVIRIDRLLTPDQAAQRFPEIVALLERWQQEGAVLSGIEIDYDSPTAGLRDYAAFLTRLRGVVPSSLPLSITTLPTWLTSPDLLPVLRAVDEAVLQVHSVGQPGEGLFDPDQHGAYRFPQNVRNARSPLQVATWARRPTDGTYESAI